MSYNMTDSSTNSSQGQIQGGSLGSGDPPPQHIREAKRMMCCYKNKLKCELNVILAILKESNQYFLKGCIHHTPIPSVKTTLVRKVHSICKH